MHVSSPSGIHRRILLTTRPRGRTTPATTTTNLRTPTRKRRTLSRRVKALDLAKADPSRVATEIVALDLAKEEKVEDPSLMATVLLRQAKADPREDPRPKVTARVVLESSK